MGVRGQRPAPAALLPGKSPGTHCAGGWVGLVAGSEKPRPHRGLNPEPSSQ